MSCQVRASAVRQATINTSSKIKQRKRSSHHRCSHLPHSPPDHPEKWNERSTLSPAQSTSQTSHQVSRSTSPTTHTAAAQALTSPSANGGMLAMSLVFVTILVHEARSRSDRREASNSSPVHIDHCQGSYSYSRLQSTSEIITEWKFASWSHLLSLTISAHVETQKKRLYRLASRICDSDSDLGMP
jgi:hypothetical protein